MFAVFSPRTFFADKSERNFLCPIGSIVSKDIRLSNPIREYPFTFDCILVLGGTGRRQPSLFLYISNSFSFMPRTNEICNAENNSICITTDAHETCTLTGDPFKDIAQFGFDLHGCKISFRKKPNKHGHTVTGWFNISGRMESGAGNSYEDIIMYIVERSRAYQVYVSLCHKARKERYWANRVKREAATIKQS